MDQRNFHQKFVDSLRKRDVQLAALVVVPLTCFLLAEAVVALMPEPPAEDRCAREVRAQVAERLLGAMVFDIGRAEVVPAGDGSLTVEIAIEANGIPLRTAYRCDAGEGTELTLRRLWTRRV